jgi:hypothetical protein
MFGEINPGERRLPEGMLEVEDGMIPGMLGRWDVIPLTYPDMPLTYPDMPML